MIAFLLNSFINVWEKKYRVNKIIFINFYTFSNIMEFMNETLRPTFLKIIKIKFMNFKNINWIIGIIFIDIIILLMDNKNDSLLKMFSSEYFTDEMLI